MMVNTENLVPMTDANRNFSKVVRLVDESGMAVILKNNKPAYIVVDFDEYSSISKAMQMRESRINTLSEELLTENEEALRDLAK